MNKIQLMDVIVLPILLLIRLHMNVSLDLRDTIVQHGMHESIYTGW